MTYEQSIKNIEILKNLVWPWDVDYIFFDFKTETEFEVIFLDTENSNKIEEYLPIKYRAKLPIAHIHENDLGHEVLYYVDDSFLYQINLVTNEINMHDVLGQFRHCPTQVKLEMAALARKLENL
ncbi:MAG: hypothetical protein AABY53_07060 [Bdellovibrionota bacterium]